MVWNDVNNYRGSGVDVLTYFFEHRRDLAVGCGSEFNRTRLALTARALYDDLSKFGLLDRAIPDVDLGMVERGRLVGKGLSRLSPEDITRICDYHSITEGNALGAAKRIRAEHGKSHGVSTILEYWRRNNLRIHKPGNPTNSKSRT